MTSRSPSSSERQRRKLVAPSLDPLTLASRKYRDQLDDLKATIGKGDRFTSEDVQTGVQYRDYASTAAS